MLRVLDLFSGIGGFSLGLERAGMQTVAFCEIDPFCQAVLRKHWPNIPIYGDIRELTAKRVAEDGIGPVDVICGGFPCQDISVAGKGAGIEGERSGLWREYARLIGEIRPRYVIVENVAALLGRGIGRVLGDLAEIGYDAEWHCIPASYVGSPQQRDRTWIVAHTESERISKGHLLFGNEAPQSSFAYRSTFEWPAWHGYDQFKYEEPRLESKLGRKADGVSMRAYRINSLGNAVVPQIPEIIGRAIIEAEAPSRPAER